MNKTEKAYNDIFKILDKHKDLIAFDIDSLKRKAELHKIGVKLVEEYGLDLNPTKITNTGWNRINDYRTIGWYGEKYNRTISWSVDGRQPDDELLFNLSFPTGAYIFGNGSLLNKEYPVKFFQGFFSELKSYSPDYIDEANKSLYWSIENAKEIFNNFPSILKKYHELNKEDRKLREIEEMKAKLAKLESETSK